MNQVLWNNETDLCIALTTELDEEEFIEEATKTHEELTGDTLDINDWNIGQKMKSLVWVLELKSLPVGATKVL